MAEQPPPSEPSEGTTPPPDSIRRSRAPTITIDTSAVQTSSEHLNDMNQNPGNDPTHHHADEAQPVPSDPSPRLRPAISVQTTSPEIRASNSFESKESRPTSPHNVSSTHQWGNPHGFLAVPTGRSRGASLDAEVESSSTSDMTYVNTQRQSSDSTRKSLGDRSNGDIPDDHVLPDDQALIPDPGTEGDFERDNNPFAFAPGHMTKLLNPKSLGAFHAVGGLRGLEKGLRTDHNSGLSVDENCLDGSVSFDEATTNVTPTSVATPANDLEMLSREPTGGTVSKERFVDRKRIFEDNRLPERKPKSILQLMWLTYNDKVLIVLSVAAVIALALGFYQAFGQPQGGVEWIEGVAILVAIIVVVVVGALNDWQKERQFAKLNKKKENREVKLVRSGKTQQISVHDVLVGDVLLVEPGDILPVDGVFIAGHSVRCDESSATGESDIIKKTPADEVYRAMEANQNLKKMDPFMISGAKITEGFGRILVTAVGIHSTYGKTMLSLQESNDMTPLQSKLNKLAEYIAKIGSAMALLLFVILLIKFLAQLPHNTRTPAEKGQQFLNFLIVAVTIVVVAVPEGLPLAVTLALAYATRRMLKDNNLVRVLRSCETMGNATTVCSDKTGTLTQNVMTVVAGSIGTSSRFSHQTLDATDKTAKRGGRQEQNGLDAVPTSEFIASLSNPVKFLWKDSIVINSTAFESDEDGKSVFVGSKTETALLDFARDYLGLEQVSVERSNAPIAQMIPFDSDRKCMAVVIKHQDGKGYRLLVKGASEIMLKYCSMILREPTRNMDATALTADNMKMLSSLIDEYAKRSLRTIGFIYRDFQSDSWPPRGVKRVEDDPSQALFEDMCKHMTFLGLVGIRDPVRPGVTEAVKDCITAGVFPRMVTGDNILTAKAIATECGIFTPGGLALEGPAFRKMSKMEQRSIIPKLQVLARSSPEDKRTLVKRLREMGETVAVTGDGTNDAPALKTADVGFSMNIVGTEVAKEASDIILMDDNFSSIVKALMWGRAVNDAVRKFLQFQITVNITAVLLAFISAISSSQEKSVLTAVQLLWVNLIMDTMAALALATDPPSRKILNRKPDPKSAPLISVTMWKMIIGQAIYQLVVTLVLYFAGARILNYSGLLEGRQLQTLIFNTFVWMQIFNSLNNRRLDNQFNVFEGIQNNLFFIGIFFVMIGGQLIIVFVGGYPAFQAQRQTGAQWGIALVLGAISIPIGIIVRLVPDELAVQVVPSFIRDWSSRRRENPFITDEENPSFFEFNQALYEIRAELSFIKKYKGGRLNSLRFTLQHPKEALMASRSPSRSRASSSLPRTPQRRSDEQEDTTGSQPPPAPTPESRRKRGRSRSNSALAGAAMAGIIAGSVAGGWSPVERGRAEGDGNIRSTRRRSKSDLSREVRMDSHPDSNPMDDIALKDNPVEQAGGLPPSQANETTPQFGYGPYSGEPSTATNDKQNTQDADHNKDENEKC